MSIHGPSGTSGTGGMGETGAAAGAGARRALIIANDTYDHASLSQLRAPEADARALADVLGDPDIGGFEVTVVHNEASYEVQARIDDLFADSRPDDLLLLHFSGHGLKSDSGELFFAARNTRPDRLGSTSVAADFVQRCMRAARARTIVLFLDCCYGGAFSEGVAVRAAGPVNVVDAFPAGRLGGGRGRAVISASSAMEYAFEGTTLTADHEPQPSIFTSAVVEGLRSGEADRDEDGLVALSELYDFVFDRVREQNPRQTPGRDVEMSGEVYLARSRRRRIRSIPISDALTAALGNPDPTYRRGAVMELRDRLAHPDLGVALGALEALQQVVRSDTKSVADDATAIIDAAAPTVTPTSVDFGELPPDADVALERVLQVHGLPLAREVRVEAEPPLSALAEGGMVTLTFSPTGSPYAGAVTIIGPTGSVIVPVEAGVASRWATPSPPPDAELGAEPPAGAATFVAEAPSRTVAEPTTAPAAETGAESESRAGAGAGAESTAEPAGVAMATGLTERRVVPVETSPEPPQESPPESPPESKPEPQVPRETMLRSGTAEGGRAREESATPATAGEAGTSMTRLGPWSAWALFLGGLLVIIRMTSWYPDQYSWTFDVLLLGPGVRGLLAISAGILILAPRVRPEVALGYLTGVTVAGGLGAVASIGAGVDFGVDRMEVWWLLGVVGQALIGVTGVLVISIAAWRSPLPRGPIAWRNPATSAVLVAGGASTLLLVGLADYVSASAFAATITYLSAGATVGLVFVALAARPSAAGRLMLLAWAVAGAGFVLSTWVLLTNTSGDWAGMLWLVLSAIAIAVTGGFIGRRTDSSAGS